MERRRRRFSRKARPERRIRFGRGQHHDTSKIPPSKFSFLEEAEIGQSRHRAEQSFGSKWRAENDETENYVYAIALHHSPG
jgi:hypothetical protein